MNKHYATMNEWKKISITPPGGSQMNAIEYIFSGATFFQHYAKIKKMNSSGVVSETVEQFGANAATLANSFLDLYGELLYYRPHSRGSSGADLLADVEQVEKGKRLADTVLLMNKHKYLKLMESIIYEYNPIENVDEFTITGDWTQDGGQRVTRTITGTQTDTTKTKTDVTITNTAGGTGITTPTTTTYTSPDDSSSFYAAEKTEQTGGTTQNTQGAEDNNVQTLTRAYSDGYADETSTTHDPTGLSVTAADNVYGESADNVDSMHGTKVRRHGNIGVTSAQSLITESLELEIINNVLPVFFEDMVSAICLDLW